VKFYRLSTLMLRLHAARGDGGHRPRHRRARGSRVRLCIDPGV